MFVVLLIHFDIDIPPPVIIVIYRRCRYKAVAFILTLPIRSIVYPLPNYISFEDLEQQMYFAFLKAVNAYKADEEYKFNTYLSFNILSELNHLIFRKETKKTEISYNQTVADNDTEIIELLEDTEATEYIKNIEDRELYTILHNAVNSLPSAEKDVIIQHFFLNKSYNAISIGSGITENELIRTIRKAIRTLRKNKKLYKSYLSQ